jgi:glycerol kinase
VNRKVLVIDQGSHASRAMVFDQNLAVLAHASKPVTTHFPAPGRVELDARELLDTTRQVIDEAVRDCGGLPECAGLATQRSTIVCWRQCDGQPLLPALSWRDTRAPLPANLDPDLVRELTGLRPSPHYGAAKLRWCLDQLEDRLDGLIAGPLASFLIHGLCREHPSVVDPCNASRTLLYDSGRRRWSPEMLTVFDIHPDLLPEPVSNRHSYGHIDTRAGEIPLAVVSGDQSTVPFASGPIDPGTVWIQLGTGAFLQRISDQPLPGMLHSLIWDDGSLRLEVCEGTVNAAAAAIDHVCSEHRVDWSALTPDAAALIGAAKLPLFINAVGGLGSPDWLPEYSTRFLGEGKMAARLAAVLESILFLLCRNLERMGAGVETLVVSGGLSRIDELCQALADLSGVTVQRGLQAEATAVGTAALLFDQMDGLERTGQRFQPGDPGYCKHRHEIWQSHMP